MSHNASEFRRLIVLGSTGSIGTNTLAVVDHLNTLGRFRFEVVGVAAGCNSQVLNQQIKSWRLKHVAVADSSVAHEITDCDHVYSGSDSARELIEAIARPGDLVVAAIVGAAGIPATLAAIDRGCHIALANKEMLVAAGKVVMPKIRSGGGTLIPIDSEHSAIFQCLQSGRSIEEVKRVVITASGGPFRTWSNDEIEHASPEQALNHPTWNMGPKVTIDSASLMNKALEIIEAHWLFDLPSEKIDVIIHPQSLIHSFVEFVDGSVIAQLSPPDMKTPIQYALTWPHRSHGISDTLNWTDLTRMDFEPVNHEKFIAPALAHRVIEMGGTAGAIFNAANEVAVDAFLSGEIPFPRITEIVKLALDKVPTATVKSLQDVMDADDRTRTFVQNQLSNSSRPTAEMETATVENRR